MSTKQTIKTGRVGQKVLTDGLGGLAMDALVRGSKLSFSFFLIIFTFSLINFRFLRQLTLEKQFALRIDQLALASESSLYLL